MCHVHGVGIHLNRANAVLEHIPLVGTPHSVVPAAFMEQDFFAIGASMVVADTRSAMEVSVFLTPLVVDWCLREI